MGLVRDKTDKKDAYRIALFAQSHLYELKIYLPPRPEIIRLRHLSELRDRLMNVSQILQVPLNEHGEFVNVKYKKEAFNKSSYSIKAVRSDVKKIDVHIATIIDADTQLAHLKKLITSVPGIGNILHFKC